MSAGRHAQVLQSVEQRVELNHPVEQGRLGEVCSEAQDDVRLCLLLARKPCHHLAYPVCRFRPAVGIGEQQVVVLCGFGTEGDSQLLGGCHLCAKRHERQLEVAIALLPELQKSTRVIHTAVVDHNHLIFGIILREQCLHIVA